MQKEVARSSGESDWKSPRILLQILPDVRDERENVYRPSIRSGDLSVICGEDK
jgi:hypothetical protein